MIVRLAASILITGVELAAAYASVRADLRRRMKLSAAFLTIAVIGLGMAAFEVTSFFSDTGTLQLLASLAFGVAGVQLVAHFSKAKALIVADVGATAASLVCAIACLACP